jgi:hypothetical protein
LTSGTIAHTILYEGIILIFHFADSVFSAPGVWQDNHARKLHRRPCYPNDASLFALALHALPLVCADDKRYAMLELFSGIDSSLIMPQVNFSWRQSSSIIAAKSLPLARLPVYPAVALDHLAELCPLG